MYVYVGGKGSDGSSSRSTILVAGGYNGGGSNGSYDGLSSAGGGATDFRIVSGNWNDNNSLISRIMVAGAGGGSGISNTGAPGGLNGGIVANLYGENGSQITGGGPGTGYTHNSMSTAGGFGYGGNSGYYGTGAGGSGYYGGGGGNHITPVTSGGGGGGSSYVSGAMGCITVTSANNYLPKSGCANGTTDITCSYHYSGYIFSNISMIAGNASMPTHDGTSTMTGNTGNGYARITLISYS
jgi:hypothetical protein